MNYAAIHVGGRGGRAGHSGDGGGRRNGGLRNLFEIAPADQCRREGGLNHRRLAWPGARDGAGIRRPRGATGPVRDERELDIAAAELTASGAEVLAVPCDVTVQED